jgi:hypothetical protein
METFPVKSKDCGKGLRVKQEIIKSDKPQEKICGLYTGIVQYPDKNPVSC